jgi:hypothetical protein
MLALDFLQKETTQSAFAANITTVIKYCSTPHSIQYCIETKKSKIKRCIALHSTTRFKLHSTVPKNKELITVENVIVRVRTRTVRTLPVNSR